MTNTRRFNERGVINAWQVATIGLSVLVLGLGSFGIWAYVAYNDASSDVSDKIKIAVAQAKEDQSNTDEEKFQKAYNQPNTKFIGPDNYCGLTFMYPKTWSVYESEQIQNGGDYKAYLNPVVVPPVSDSQQFAMRVLIEQRDYDDVVSQYDSLVQSSKLRQSSTTSNGHSATRLTGDFNNNIRGDAVIYRCRDKTITLRTDAATTFKNDFQSLIGTVDFNE